MKCPYCAEEIKDEAILCRHCGRDLSFFIPIEAKFRLLDQRTSKLETSTAEIPESLENYRPSNSHAPSLIAQTDKPALSSLAALVFLNIFLTVTVSFLYYFHSGGIGYYSVSSFAGSSSAKIDPNTGQITVTTTEPSEEIKNLTERIDELESSFSYQRAVASATIFIPLLLAIPIFSGLLLGIMWRGSHLKYYLLLGGSAGMVELILFVVTILITVGLGRRGGPIVLLIGSILLGSIFLAKSIFGFSLGGLVGDRLERKLFPSQNKTGFAERLAEKFISDKGVKEGTQTDAIHRSKVKRMADLISSLAPILALFGTIITAIFGYLAAIAAAKK